VDDDEEFTVDAFWAILAAPPLRNLNMTGGQIAALRESGGVDGEEVVIWADERGRMAAAERME
jgi:hypothetical protein